MHRETRDERSQGGAGKNVCDEVHTQQNPRQADTASAEEQPGGETRIKGNQRDGYGKSGDGVAGRKGELVGRQQSRPAVRHERAGTAASDAPLQNQEQRDAEGYG